MKSPQSEEEPYIVLSPSLRGSGLKWEIARHTGADAASPALRGSGLKSAFAISPMAIAEVSLFTREWIEMETLAGDVRALIGLPLYEGVD